MHSPIFGCFPHPEDNVALLRVLNVPTPRGIGAATVSALEARARDTGQSLWDVIGARDVTLGKKLTGALNAFHQTISVLQEDCKVIFHPPSW